MPDPNAAGAGTPPAPASDSAAGGGICEIDPTACPKAGDIKKLSERAVKQQTSTRCNGCTSCAAANFEINPFWSFSLNDQFVSHLGPGLNDQYYLTRRPRGRPERHVLPAVQR